MSADRGARRSERPVDRSTARATSRSTARRSPLQRRLAWLLAWLGATALLWASVRAMSVERAAALLAAAHPAWLLAAVGCNTAILALWAAQSLLFVPRGWRVGWRRMLAVTALTTTATNTIPAFLGQASGVVIMAERTGIGAAASLAVLAQHQAVEGVAKVAALLLAAAIAPLPAGAHRAVVAFTAGACVLLVALLLVARAGAGDASPMAPSAPGAPLARRQQLRRAVATWAAGLEALREPRRLAMGLGIALLMKLAEAGGHAAVLRALDVRAPVGTPAVAVAAVNLASSISASPGNLGTYEAGAVLAYRRMGVAPDRAAALALAAHVCYLLPLVGIGWVVLAAEAARRRR